LENGFYYVFFEAKKQSILFKSKITDMQHSGNKIYSVGWVMVYWLLQTKLAQPLHNLNDENFHAVEQRLQQASLLKPIVALNPHGHNQSSVRQKI